jgi:hypothetical protein
MGIPPDDLEKVSTLPGMKMLAFQYNSSITDEHLARLANTRDLATVVIIDASKLTNKRYAPLAQITRLKTLSLSGVSVNDATLEALRAAPELLHLRLGGDVQITEKRLRELRSLAKLKRLDLSLPVETALIRTLSEGFKLKSVRLNVSKLKNKDLEPLTKLATLRSLTLDGEHRLNPPRVMMLKPDGKPVWSNAIGFGFGVAVRSPLRQAEPSARPRPRRWLA